MTERFTQLGSSDVSFADNDTGIEYSIGMGVTMNSQASPHANKSFIIKEFVKTYTSRKNGFNDVSSIDRGKTFTDVFCKSEFGHTFNLYFAVTDDEPNNPNNYQYLLIK